MKYFLINGFLPIAHSGISEHHGKSQVYFSRTNEETIEQRRNRYQEHGIEILKFGENIFLNLRGIGRLSLFIYGIYEVFLMVIAPSQRKAYLVGNCFRAITTCFHGNPPMEQANGYLVMFTGQPSPDMNITDIAKLINPLVASDDIACKLLESELHTGTGIDQVQIQEACDILSKAIKYPQLAQALMHLEYSRILVWGFMVGSYYESHYREDRKSLTRSQLERIYLENRFRYDSAFVSAFRGIECILGKPYFKKQEISSLLIKIDREFGTSFYSLKHRSWHESFSSRHKWWKYESIIAYYLKLRNTVSAHGNPSPPCIVMEDQVFEIQYLLQDMLAKILFPNEDSE